MLNTEQVLIRLNIDPQSVIRAVQQVRQLIEGSKNPLGAAKAMFDNLTRDTPFTYTDANEARMIVARLVQDAIKLGEQYDPDDALRRAAQWIANYRVTDPWAFAKPDNSTVITETVTRHDVAVEVKEDGKLKKGGKQMLAQALYAKNPGLDNKALIQLFMKELDMSEAGARTYVYNCKKAAK